MRCVFKRYYFLAGNKKMTIISKFNVFGIDAKELSHKLQLAMSSSASVVLGTGFRFRNTSFKIISCSKL